MASPENNPASDTLNPSHLAIIHNNPFERTSTSMCGIFGIVTDKDQALGPILIEAARRLTYRGYDSVGVATLSADRIDLRKDAGRVDDVAKKYNLAEMSGQ